MNRARGGGLARRIRAAFAGLALAVLPTAAGAEEVVVDLIGLQTPKPFLFRVGIGQSLSVRVAPRIPTARYRVTIDKTGLPSERFEPEPLPASLTDDAAQSGACQPLQQALRADTERAAIQKVGELFAKGAPSSCASLKARIAEVRAAMEYRVPRTYVLAAAESLDVRVERLDADGRTVVRSWNVRVEPLSLPSDLSWPYRTEEGWLVSEIARDIAEMLVYAKSRSLPAEPQHLVVIEEGAGTDAGAYQVTARLGQKLAPLSRTIQIDQHVWSPGTYTAWSRAILDSLQLKPAPSPSQVASFEVLLDLRSAVVNRENQRVSRRLENGLLQAEAHEEAALLLGAFALREAAGDFYDVRHELSRMSAHLALARALRPGSAFSREGELAQAVLDTLLGREVEALQRVGSLEKGLPTPAQSAWLGALRLRNTGDWRALTAPNRASLLERLEYFRALCRTQGGLRALEFLRSSPPEPIPDWGRVALEGRFKLGGRDLAVETGNSFAPSALPLELKEAEQVSGFPGQKAASGGSRADFDLPWSRCIQPSSQAGVAPQVIAAAAWNAFFQRHLGHALQSMEKHLDAQSLPEEAVAFQIKAKAEFSATTLFPLIEPHWEHPHRRSDRVDPSWGACEGAVELLRRAPWLVTATNWLVLQRQCFKSGARNRIPDASLWFSQGPPRGTNYDVHRRLGQILNLDAAAVEQALKRAPYDAVLILWKVGGWQSGDAFGRRLTEEQFAATWGRLLGYHADAERARAAMLSGDAGALRMSKLDLCERDAESCSRVGVWLFMNGFEDDGANALARALREARDRVSISHDMDWLVDYYYDHGETAKAVEVAEAVAGVYSYPGLQTKARLLYRLGRYDESETWYKKLAERYPEGIESLRFFYVRYEQRQGDHRYRTQADEARRRLFPDGLDRVALAGLKDPPRPNEGFRFLKVDDLLKPLGLMGGDVVVALDGFRVRSEPQWYCVKGFTDDPAASVIVWRFGKYLELKANIRRTYFGPPHGPGPLVKSSPR